jgi:hypothetical protein
MNFLIENYTEIFAGLMGLVTLATVITAATPNKKDDEVVGIVRKVLEFISLRLGK